MRLHQLTGIDPTEIVVPLTNAEISSLKAHDEHWERASRDLGEGGWKLIKNTLKANNFRL